MRTKRALAFVMALVLSFTTFTSDLGAISVFAEPSDDSAYEEYVETSTEEVSVEEVVAEMTAGTEVEGVKEEASAETEESLAAPEEENVEEVLPLVEETEENESDLEDEDINVEDTIINEEVTSELEVPVEEAVAEPVIFTDSANGITVKVTDSFGAFPKGTQMIVKPVVSKEISEEIGSEEYVAFDITFIDADRKEVQPADGKEVKVEFIKALEDANTDIELFHMDDLDAVAEPVASNVAEDGTVVFDASGFSIYVWKLYETSYRYVNSAKVNTYINDQYVQWRDVTFTLDSYDTSKVYSTKDGSITNIKIWDSYFIYWPAINYNISEGEFPYVTFWGDLVTEFKVYYKNTQWNVEAYVIDWGYCQYNNNGSNYQWHLDKTYVAPKTKLSVESNNNPIVKTYNDGNPVDLGIVVQNAGVTPYTYCDLKVYTDSNCTQEREGGANFINVSDSGTYYFKAIVKDEYKDTYEDSDAKAITITINPKSIHTYDIIWPSAVENLKYSTDENAEKHLLTADPAMGKYGTFKYTLVKNTRSDSDYIADIPTYTNAGLYNVYCRLNLNENYVYKSYSPNTGKEETYSYITKQFPITVNVARADLPVPTAKTGLYYNGNQQELISCDQMPEKYGIKFSFDLNNRGNALKNEKDLLAIKGKEVKEYIVYYQYSYWGNTNEQNYDTKNGTIQSLKVSINPSVTFDANGGSWKNHEGSAVTVPASLGGEYNAAFSIISDTVERDGYTFAGWFTTIGGEDEISLDSQITANSAKTLYAHWNIIDCDLHLIDEMNGNLPEGMNELPIKYTPGTVLVLPVLTKDGYNFLGWFEENASEKTVEINATDSGEKTFYAHWQDSQAPTVTVSANIEAKKVDEINKSFFADNVTFTGTATDNVTDASELTYAYKTSTFILSKTDVEVAKDFTPLSVDAEGKFTFAVPSKFNGYVYVRATDAAENVGFIVAHADGTVVYASVPETKSDEYYTKFSNTLSFDVSANGNNIKKFTVDGNEYAVTSTNKDENTKTVTLNGTTGLDALSAEAHNAVVYFDYLGIGAPTDNKTEFTLKINKAEKTATVTATDWVYDQYDNNIISTCTNTDVTAKYYVKDKNATSYPDEETKDFDALLPGEYDVKVVYGADANYNVAEETASFKVSTPEVYFYLKKADGKYELVETVAAGKVAASVFNELVINASSDTQLADNDTNKEAFIASAAENGNFKKIQAEGCNPQIIKLTLINLNSDKRAEEDGHHSNNSKHFHVDFTITKAVDNEATVSMNDWTYGDTANTPEISQKTDKLGGAQNVIFEYYKGNQKLNGVPSEAGEYKVKAIFGETMYYAATTVEDMFTIRQKGITLTWKLDNKIDINRVTYNREYHYATATMSDVINNDNVKLNLSNDVHINVHDYDNVTKASISGAKSGNYKLANPEFEWRINPLDLSSRTRVDIGDATFNGNPLEPNKLDVFDTNNDWNPWNDLTLTKGTDYDVVYTNNVNASNSALATITFKGNYTGSVTKNFQIHRFNVNTQNPQFGPYVSIETISDYVYDGTEKTPELTVKFNYYNFAERKFMSELIDPKYYTLSYKDNVQVNEGNEIPTVTLVFKDWTNEQPTNFKGSLYKQFNITKAQGSIVLERNNESFTWYTSFGSIFARLVYGKDLGEYKIVENKGGGSLSYLYGSGRHEDSPYITAFNYGKNANDYVYVAPKAEGGYDTIHVISAETRNYYQAECEIDAFSENGTLDVTALDASATYDGEVHQINVSAEKNGQYKLDSDVIRVTYAPTKADYYWTGRGLGTRYIPDGEYTADFGYVNAGTYHIAYRVECNGYFTQEGVKTLTINKREVTPTWVVADEWNHSVEKTTNWGDACGYTAREYTVKASLNNVIDKDKAAIGVSLRNNKGTKVDKYTTVASITGDVNNNYVLKGGSYKWEIFYHDFPANIDARGDKNAFGWYKGDITLSKRSWNPWDYTNNYLITDKSPLLPGNQPNWRDSLVVSKEGKNAQFKYYLQTWDGYVSPEKTFTYSLDKTAPTGAIKLGFDTLDKDLKWFVKNGASLWTTSNDANSGVASVSYSYDGWFYMPYNQFIGIPVSARKDYKNIYVKITDWAGNETVLHADELIAYNDAAAVTREAEYTRTTKEDIEITVKPNGNTIKNVKLFGMPLVRGIDYTVSRDNKTITLKGAYLDRLPGRMVGAMNEVQPYFFSVSYNPLGKAYNQYVEIPGFWNFFTGKFEGGYSYGDSKGADAFDTFFTINVKKATDELVITNDLSKTYDGAPVSSNDVSFNSLSDGNTVIEYKVKGADDETYTETAPVNAGDYTVRVTKNESFNYYESSAEKDFTIAKRNVIIETLSDSKVQGSADPAFRAVVRNAIEPVSAFAWRIVGNEAPGEYEISHTIAPSEAAYPNYTFTIIHGTFTITALPEEVVTLPGPTFTPVTATPVEAEEVEEVEEVEEEEIVIEEPATPEAPEVEEEPTVEIVEEPVPETVAARCVMHWAILGLAALYAAYVVVRALQNKKELDGDEETANN